ncbi:MAG: aminopeptidase, partial [Desulfobacterales bacterium]
MLTEKQLNRYADVLIWGLQTAKSRRIYRNDIVLVRFDLAAVRLAEILFAKLLEAGAHPLMRLNPTAAMERDFYSLANSKQLVYIPPGEENLFKRLNGSISIFAPESMTHLAKIDPQKIAMSVLSKKKLRDVLDKREARKNFSWTLCMFPTVQLAKHARISQKAYCAQIAR